MNSKRRALLLGGVAALIGGMAWSARRRNRLREAIRLEALFAPGSGFTEMAQRLHGTSVALHGYMAPPLEPDTSLFVLTAVPMSACPFCSSEAIWPREMVLVYLTDRQPWVDYYEPIIARGVLDLGVSVEAATGLVSEARLVEATFERV